MPADDLTMTACGMCQTTSDVDEGMVGCDSCNRWFHYRCVGVNENVAEAKNWFCSESSCQEYAKKLTKRQEPKTGKQRKKATSGNESDKSSVTSEIPGQTLDQKLKALEKERKAKEREMEEERILKEKRMEMDRFLKEREMEMQEELREKEMQQERELLEVALERKRNYLARVKAMRESYQVQMESIQQELIDGSNQLKRPNELCPNGVQSIKPVQEQKTAVVSKSDHPKSSSELYSQTPVRSSAIKGKISRFAMVPAVGSKSKSFDEDAEEKNPDELEDKVQGSENEDDDEEE